MASIARHQQRKYVRDDAGRAVLDDVTGKPQSVVVGEVWRARYRDAAGREHARHFKRKSDAQRWLDTVTASVVTGSYVDPKRAAITVQTMADSWLANPAWSPATRARNESIVRRHIIPRWGRARLATLDHEALQAWVNELAAGQLAPATVRKTVGVLHGVLEAAVRGRRIPRNPADGLALPRAGVAKRRYLDAVQVEALASAAGEYAPVIYVLAYCGLRWGEVAALQVGDVDLARRRLTVERSVTEVNGHLEWGAPKDHQRRSVPFPAFLTDALTTASARRADHDPLFVSTGGGVLRVRNARRDWFDRAAATAGVSGLTPHELRHTAASLAIAAGASVLGVQRMLGHEKASMTLDVYSDLFEEDLDAVGARLDAARVRAVADSARTRERTTEDAKATGGR